MIERHESFDEQDTRFKNLEAAIFAARNYVVPSEDLRPRTLEVAREKSAQLSKIHRIGFAAAAALVVWCSCVLLAGSANAFRESFVAPFGDELLNTAIEISAEQNVSIEWGLVDAFSHYRCLQGNRIHASQINSWSR